MKATFILAGAASAAWDLTQSGNTTWPGNDNGGTAGGIYYFDNPTAIFNGTGSCTVSASGAYTFMAGFGMWVGTADGSGSQTFYDFGDSHSGSMGFLVNSDDMPADDLLSVNCQNDAEASGLFLSSFPNNLDDVSGRGSVATKNADFPDSFYIDFGDGFLPDGFIFDSGVTNGDVVGNAMNFDKMAGDIGNHLWFSGNWTSSGGSAPSYSYSIGSA